MRARVFRTLAAACILTCLASASFADNNAAAMVMRIEPADNGIAKVLRDSHTEEVAFMMPLYEGDKLVVESPNTTVQVRIFGGDDMIVRAGAPLTIGAEAEERTMFSGLLSALSDKVFRNNQMSRRNLVTRSDGQLPDLVLHGFDADSDKQALVGGRRSLLLRWNLDLDSASYRIEDATASRGVASGTAEGDYAFADNLDIEAGHDYVVFIESADGLQARGVIVGVDALPELTPVDERLGTAGAALRLVELATRDNGRWKFEAIQGVLELSPDDIDRATLIKEIAAL
jgi:hypothetical protein